ncbi:glycosyltransferase family 2 protein [Nocardioides sp.]|uniref:glycosyltransferase family 2 protein n=1 Tax=Nocardioides sp. TaxID=35761 RepID=UPI0035B08F47
MTRASVLIPIHDKPTTLPLTVDTVLRQTVADLEVLLIGDGVTDDVRAVVAELTDGDERVRFLDFPKGPHHGERYRHDAVQEARSDAIFYLCDDDLLLPDHVADLLSLLEEHSFVQSLNGEVRPDGSVRFYAADLGDPEVVAMHLRDDIRFCSVSITGTAHTRALYDAADDRWDTTPTGWWPDHWQFRKLMRHPSYSGATSSRMTALQFPTSSDGRDTWSAEARVEELRPWHALVVAPGAQDEIDRRCESGRREQLVEERATIALLQRDLAWLRAEHEQTTEQKDWLRSKFDESQGHLEWLKGQHAAALATIERLDAKVARKDEVIARLRAKTG